MLIALILACDNTSPEAEDAAGGPTVTTAPVVATRWRPTVEITGTLQPVASVQLGFEIGGRLASLRIQRGAVVAPGDELATLERAIAAAQTDQAHAGVVAAEAQLALAEQAWRRVEQVGDAVSDQARTEARTGRELAAAGFEQARATERMARTQLSFTTLRAPIGGVVTGAPDNAGALVGPGAPLFVIEDLAELRLCGTAPASEAWLVAGLDVEVFPGTPGAEAGFPAFVERVIPSLDPATRRLPVEIRVPSPPPVLRAHGLARAVITAAEEEEVWSIPKGALVARPEFAVLVLVGDSPSRLPVVVLQESDGQVLVRGELGPHPSVVVDPPHGFGE